MPAPIAAKILTPGAIYQREWRKKHPERYATYRARYRSSPDGIATEREYALRRVEDGSVAKASRRYRGRHPEREKEIKRRYVAGCRAKLDALKAGPCVDCGNTFPPECMDFDHVRGVKVNGIGRMVDYAPDVLATELAKCELVCANCHRIRTKKRRVK